mmetsp:Transcript_13423/g.15174  ORF Transcript_13423/g.15174 Transcript_13423/m.15174 type:complete len:392 (+) Transcript_13423:170-1345(+)
MKFSIVSFCCWLSVATITSSVFIEALTTPSVPKVTNTNANTNNAMSQYEAALKAAFEQAAAATATTTSPSLPPPQESFPQVKTPVASTTMAPHMIQDNHDNVIPQEELHAAASNAFLTKHIEQEEKAVDQYEAAIQDVFESTTPATTLPPTTIVFGDEHQEQDQDQEPEPEPDWDTISKDIHHQIVSAQSKQNGEPLSPSATGEIVGTVLAGSAAVLGSAAIVGSPLVMGAALGYASTHVLGGKRGEALSQASKVAMTEAIQFSKSQLALEQGDISKASKRILNHIQHEATDRFSEVQQDISDQAQHAKQEFVMAPNRLAKKTKQLVTKDNAIRSFKALKTFLQSEEVQNAKNTAVKAMKDGLESDELKAVQKRATISLKDISSSSSSSNE